MEPSVAKSDILEGKEGFNKTFTKCLGLRKVVSLICEKFYFGDRVPLS